MTKEELKEFQKRFNLNNCQLARELCVSRSLVEKMRAGDKPISKRTEKQIADLAERLEQ